MKKNEFDEIAEKLGEGYIIVKDNGDNGILCGIQCPSPVEFLGMLTAVVVANPNTIPLFKHFAKNIDEVIKKT